MPTYEYTCNVCGKHEERFCSISERNLPFSCTEQDCKGSMLLQISVPHFVLEGVTGDFPTAAQKWEATHYKANTKRG